MSKWRFQYIFSWLKERFPVPHALLACAVYGKVDATLRLSDLSPQRGPLLTLSGLGATVLFFLLLRIIDEHKDFKKDAVTHPERVLQRGLVTLSDLRILGFLCFGAMTAYSAACSDTAPGSLAAFIVVVLWTTMMSFDFFVGTFQKSRPLLHASSHLFVTVLLVIWIAATLSQATPTAHQVALTGAIAAQILLASAALEVARKTFVRQENLTEGDSYSRTLGFGPALVVTGVLTAAASVADAAVFQVLGLPAGILLSLGFGAAAIFFLVKYHKTEQRQSRQIVVSIIGLELIASAVVVVSAAFFR